MYTAGFHQGMKVGGCVCCAVCSRANAALSSEAWVCSSAAGNSHTRFWLCFICNRVQVVGSAVHTGYSYVSLFVDCVWIVYIVDYKEFLIQAEFTIF